MPKTLEEKRKYMLAWYHSHKESASATAKRSYQKHRTKRIAARNRYLEQNVDKVDAQRRVYHSELKAEVLSHYGPEGKLQCSWSGCEVTDIDMLSLDHVNNDGAQHRKSLGLKSTGRTVWVAVRKAGFPEGYQTLCMNHQFKKELQRKRNAASPARDLLIAA
jgi:hypothetical protein